MLKKLKLYPWDCFVIISALFYQENFLKRHRYHNYSDVVKAKEKVHSIQVALDSVKNIPSEIEWKPAIIHLVSQCIHWYLKHLHQKLGNEYYNYHMYKYTVERLKRYEAESNG